MRALGNLECFILSINNYELNQFKNIRPSSTHFCPDYAVTLSLIPKPQVGSTVQSKIFIQKPVESWFEMLNRTCMSFAVDSSTAPRAGS